MIIYMFCQLFLNLTTIFVKQQYGNTKKPPAFFNLRQKKPFLCNKYKAIRLKKAKEPQNLTLDDW